MIHREKKIFMKETKMMQILGKFAIPVYKNTKVHFKDICKQIIKNIFESKEMQVQFNPKIEKRIKAKWNRKYKSLKKQKKATLESADQFMAGRLILRWVRKAKLAVEKRKFANDALQIRNFEDVDIKRSKKRNLMHINKKKQIIYQNEKKKSISHNENKDEDNILELKDNQNANKFDVLRSQKFYSRLSRCSNAKDSIGSSKDLISANKRRKTKEFRESIQRVKDFFIEEEEKHEFYRTSAKKNKKLKPTIKMGFSPMINEPTVIMRRTSLQKNKAEKKHTPEVGVGQWMQLVDSSFESNKVSEQSKKTEKFHIQKKTNNFTASQAL